MYQSLVGKSQVLRRFHFDVVTRHLKQADADDATAGVRRRECSSAARSFVVLINDAVASRN
jgi:hypothetical protein